MNVTTPTKKASPENKSSQPSKIPTARDSKETVRASPKYTDQITGQDAREDRNLEPFQNYDTWLSKNPEAPLQTRESFAHALNVGIPYNVASALLLRSSENVKILSQLK